MLTYRQNTALISTNSSPEWANAYTVTVYPVGAVVRTAGTVNAIQVDVGHSFVANDKLLIDPGGDNTFTVGVLSVTADEITLKNSETAEVAVGDKIVNLGPDTGTTTPNFDGSPMAIYSDADGSTAVTNSELTCSASGEYEYWHKGDGRFWELIRTGSTVVDVIAGFGGKSYELSVYDFGAAGDGSTDDASRIQAALDAAWYNLGGVVTIGIGTHIVQSGITLNNGVVSSAGWTNLVGQNARQSIIKAGDSFSGTKVITIGGNNSASGNMIRDLAVDVNDKASVIGIYSSRIQEHSGLQDVRVENVGTGKGVQIVDDGTTPNPQMFVVRNLQVLLGTNATSATMGVQVECAASIVHQMSGISVGTTPAGTKTDGYGIVFAGMSGHLSNILVEGVAVGLRLGGVDDATLVAQGTIVDGILGSQTATASAKLVQISNVSGNANILIHGARLGAFTTTIDDLWNTVTLTDTTLEQYNTSTYQNHLGFRTGYGTDANGTLLNHLRASGNKNLSWSEGAAYFSFNDDVRSSGQLLGTRLRANQGTALVQGDFALSAGWGDSASVAVSSNSYDGKFEITVTSAGSGQGASPTITLTYTDGTWTQIPFAIVAMSGGTGTQVTPTWTGNATTLTITYTGTPVASSTYVFTGIVVG